MENWKNRQDIKKRLDGELSGMVAEEEKLKEILSCAGMVTFEETESVRRGTKKNKNLKSVVKVAVIAAALAVVSVGSVFGYEYFRRLYQHVQFEKYEGHLNQAESDAPVYNVEDSKKSENVVTNADNLVVEWGKYATNGHELYVSATIKSKDGSPILEENENHVPITTNAKISTISVTMDGETKKFIAERRYGEDDTSMAVACMAVPVSVADDLSGITFEIQYSNYDVDLEGKIIEFALENPIIKYQDFEDISVQMTVADLLKGKTAGEDKIYFSEKYPECYIEDFGFTKEEGFYDDSDYFFMTIVCDDASKEDMKKLVLQNVITGLWSQYETAELEDGRIRVKYAATFDAAYDDITHGACEPVDTTWEHLEKLKLKLKKHVAAEQTILAEGMWSTSFLLETEVVKIDEACEVLVPAVDNRTSSLMVNHIKFDAMELIITGMTKEDYDFIQFGSGEPDKPVCTLRDGTTITLQSGGGGGNSDSGWAQYRYTFPSVVAPESIERIEWHGVTIWEAPLP
ncbi:MAG: hypothetical protein ACI4GD_11580 [Lachnospiraceae bacterium]